MRLLKVLFNWGAAASAVILARVVYLNKLSRFDCAIIAAGLILLAAEWFLVGVLSIYGVGENREGGFNGF